MRLPGGNQGAGAHGEFEHEAAFRVLWGVTGELGDSLEAIVDGAGTEVQHPSGGGEVARRGDVGLERLDEMLAPPRARWRGPRTASTSSPTRAVSAVSTR